MFKGAQKVLIHSYKHRINTKLIMEWNKQADKQARNGGKGRADRWTERQQTGMEGRREGHWVKEDGRKEKWDGRRKKEQWKQINKVKE